MIGRLLLFLAFVTALGLAAHGRGSRSADPGPVAFARGGQLNMVYDIRQRPQAVYVDGRVHIVFAGRKDEAAAGKKPSTRPMLITYDPATREFSDIVTLGPGKGDHHPVPATRAVRDAGNAGYCHRRRHRPYPLPGPIPALVCSSETGGCLNMHPRGHSCNDARSPPAPSCDKPAACL